MICLASAFFISFLFISRFLMKQRVKDLLVVLHSCLLCWLLWSFIIKIFAEKYHLLIFSICLFMISFTLLSTRSIRLSEAGISRFVISALVLVISTPVFLPHHVFIRFTENFLTLISLFLSTLSVILFSSVLLVFLARMIR